MTPLQTIGVFLLVFIVGMVAGGVGMFTLMEPGQHDNERIGE